MCWLPEDYLKRILEEAESVVAEGSASCLRVPAEEFSHTGSDGVSHAGADDELSMVSSGVQGVRCFAEGTIIKTAEGTNQNISWRAAAHYHVHTSLQ